MTVSQMQTGAGGLFYAYINPALLLSSQHVLDSLLTPMHASFVAIGVKRTSYCYNDRRNKHKWSPAPVLIMGEGKAARRYAR